MTKTFFEKSPSFISLPLQNMLLEMNGGDNSFVKQICHALQQSHSENTDDRNPLVGLIDQLLNETQSELRTRWTGQLHSFSNQQVFQAIAELVSTGHLLHAGWRPTSWNGETIELHHPEKGTMHLLTLSFLLQRNKRVEDNLTQALIHQLNQLDTPHQIALTLRTPLQMNTNIPKIVRTLSYWLKEIDPNQKQTLSAFYTDNVIRLDCKYLQPRSEGSQVVSYHLPPLTARKMHHVVSNTAGKSVERIRRTLSADVPVLVSLVSNYPMQITTSGWNFLFYGLKQSQCGTQVTIDNQQFHGWFQDPFRTQVTGVMTLEQHVQPRLGEPCFSSFVHCNPWSEFTELHGTLPGPKCMIDKQERHWTLLAR